MRVFGEGTVGGAGRVFDLEFPRVEEFAVPGVGHRHHVRSGLEVGFPNFLAERIEFFAFLEQDFAGGITETREDFVR